MSNIQMSHPECEYCNRLWSWEPFNTCYRRSIRETDIDGSVENRGHFLHTEGKTNNILDLDDLRKGQRLYWKARLATGVDTIILLNGNPPEGYGHWKAFGEFIGEGEGLESLRHFKAVWFNETEQTR